jgi:hypothetical protein
MNTLLKATLTLLAITSTSFAEKGHDHDKPIPGPKGGRILEVEGGHAAFSTSRFPTRHLNSSCAENQQNASSCAQ